MLFFDQFLYISISLMKRFKFTDTDLFLCRVSINVLQTGELITHFIVGLNEMCLMSYDFGYFHVIGATN